MASLQFSYVAIDSTGAKRTGVVDADSKDAAIAQLAASGRYVTEIAEQKSVANPVAAFSQGGRAPSREDLATFTRRLADLSGAGLPLDRVLQVVGEQTENQQLIAICAATLENVRGGMPVSEALSKYPKFFNDVFTQTLRSGEASGQFPEVAGRLADFHEKEVARRSQIVSAMVYPSILAATAVFVVAFLIGFVVPKMSGVFKDLGDDLPVTTRFLLTSSDFLSTKWPLAIGIIIGAVVLFRTYLATESGRTTFDTLILKVPVMGPVVQKATVSRFARVLGTLVYGGVSILDALQIAGLSSGNRVYQLACKKVEQEVREGRAIADALRDARCFPPVLTHMVAIGEETGDLPRMLGRVSDSMDFEVDTGMRRLVSFLEPAIMLSMGVFVGFVVLSVLIPIFMAGNLVK